MNTLYTDAQQKLQEEESRDNMEVLKSSEYKARLEQKMCLSRDTPEPIYDISNCNLDKLPISYAFIKVLRKEILILSKNQLKSLATGGDLKELELLKVLDLSYNKFKVIPSEISYLKNLKVHNMSYD